MARLQPVEINLSDKEKEDLKKITSARKMGQHFVMRAQIILAADEGKNNRQIMHEIGISLNTVRLWRSRWKLWETTPLSELSALERLEDAPRAGAPARITADQRCQIEQLACQKPEKTGRPITHWTNRELADEIIKQGIVETISPRHVGRLLKRSGNQATSDSLLAHTRRR